MSAHMLKFTPAERVLGIMEGLTTNDTKPNRMNGLEYYWYTYVAEGEPYPRKFHESIYKKILDDYDSYMEYFEDVIEKADECKAFFGRFDTEAAKTWYAIADHYGTYASTYQTVAALYKNYPGFTADDLDAALDQLALTIGEFEGFMANVEETRIEANSYVYMRNHSITLQFLCDIYDYLEDNFTDGAVPEFKLENTDDYLADRYRDLR